MKRSNTATALNGTNLGDQEGINTDTYDGPPKGGKGSSSSDGIWYWSTPEMRRDAAEYRALRRDRLRQSLTQMDAEIQVWSDESADEGGRRARRFKGAHGKGKVAGKSSGEGKTKKGDDQGPH